MKFSVRIMKNEKGDYTAVCSSLPGCVTTGHTREEAREKLDEAIRGYLAAISNCPVPQDLQVVEAV